MRTLLLAVTNQLESESSRKLRFKYTSIAMILIKRDAKQVLQND
jgi:hypothetical protein